MLDRTDRYFFYLWNTTLQGGIYILHNESSVKPPGCDTTPPFPLHKEAHAILNYESDSLTTSRGFIESPGFKAPNVNGHLFFRSLISFSQASLESNRPVGRRSPNEGHEGIHTRDGALEDGDLSLGDLVHVLGEGLKVDSTSPTRDCAGSSSRGNDFTRHTATEGNDWSSASPGWHTRGRAC